MTDYFKGLLQRSMGLTPVVKPLVRPQFAVDVASAGLSGAPAGPEQSPASPADAYQPMIPAEPFQTTTGVTHGSRGSTQASDTNNALPTPERQPDLEASASQPPAIHSPHMSQRRSEAGDGRSSTRRPAVGSAESGGETDSLNIPVSRLVSRRTARNEGPLEARHPAQAGGFPTVGRSSEASSMPKGAQDLETSVPVQPLIRSDAPLHHDAARSPGQDRGEGTARGDEFGQVARHTARTQLSFDKRTASSLPYRDHSGSDEAAGDRAVEPTSAGVVPIRDGSRPEYPTSQQAPRAPSTRARERLVHSEPPSPSIEVTIGRVEVRAILPPSPAPATPARRKSPILPLDEYLKAHNEGTR